MGENMARKRHPIYQGRNSCYAIKEGVYVKRIEMPGIDTISEAVGIAYLILRDYRRGWTYDHECRKQPMDSELFKKRLRYIATLAKRHGATKSELRRIKKIIRYVAEYKRLPRELLSRAKKIIVRIRRKKRRVKAHA